MTLPKALILLVEFMVTFIIIPSFTKHFIIRGGKALLELIREHLAMVQSFLVYMGSESPWKSNFFFSTLGTNIAREIKITPITREITVPR